MLAGVQKALELPPGLAPFAVSEPAMESANGTPNRSHHFDFQAVAQKAAFENNPPSPAPAILDGLPILPFCWGLDSI